MPLFFFFNNIRIFCIYETFKCFSYNRLRTNCPNQSNHSLRQSGEGAGEVRSDGSRKRSTDRSGRRGWRGSVKRNEKAIKNAEIRDPGKLWIKLRNAPFKTGWKAHICAAYSIGTITNVVWRRERMRGMLANKDQTRKNFTELHRGGKKI